MANYSRAKTAAWMAREGVSGTAEELALYADNWLTVREETGVSLGLERAHIPKLADMRREAQRIVRERTRTRVINGRRIFVQVQNRVIVGRVFGPGTIVSVARVDEPESEWEVVPRSRLDDYPRLASEVYLEEPGEWQPDPEGRTWAGNTTHVWTWPEMAEIVAWAESKAPTIEWERPEVKS